MIVLYIIGREEALTPLKLGTILGQFQTRDLPKLRKYGNYYAGKHAILRKQPTDTGKNCAKVVVNYCHSIVENYEGYMTGKPIVYEGEDIDTIKDIFNYNDYKTEDAELLRQALIYGRSFELCYLDEEAQQRFKVLDTKQCVPIYDDTLNGDLLYVVRFWKEDRVGDYLPTDEYWVEVYSADEVITYKSNSGWSSFTPVDVKPHFYGQCPVTVFKLNEDEASVFDQVISLNDAYNELLSEEVDTFNSFADAYLIMKGVSATAEELDDAKTKRAFMIDTDADINYLTKSVSDTQIENMLKNLNDQIHKISNSPDFNDEKFMSQSGVAMRYKLTGFENNAAAIEANMRKALQRRIELLAAIVNIKDEALWRDVKIVFTRNLPTDYADIVNVVNSLRGLVSDETLLGLLPFVEDVKEELARIKAQTTEQMSMYSFGNPVIEAEEDDANV